MLNKEEFFLSIAKKNQARFCFMIWDYYQCSEIFDIEVVKDSLLCKYEHHSLVLGTPNDKLLRGFKPIGETSISYDPEWFPIIKKYFTSFSLLDSSAGDKSHNTFLCMELKEDQFKPKEIHISRRLTDDEYRLLSFRRRILFSQGLGGVGIVENNKVIGRAFAPHIVQEKNFSFAVVRDVYVDPSCRSRGFGFDLSSKICELIFSEGIDKCILWVEEDNLHAVKIYEKLGFETKDKVRSNYCLRKKDIKL